MKVLFVETGIEGHHKTYLSGLINNCDVEATVITPVNIDELNCTQIIHPIKWKEKSTIAYFKWIKSIKCAAIEVKPDVIHILDGDTIMRYFGVGFQCLSNWPIVITYHHFFEGWIRKLSYKLMLNGNGRISVVHTDEILKRLLGYHCDNVVHIEYPVFWFDRVLECDSIQSKIKMGLPLNIPVFGILGATDNYKGTRVLLEAIKNVKSKVCFFFAGKESDVTKEEIINSPRPENVQIKTILKWLTDEEYVEALTAVDYLVMPYTPEFNGASGPLADGVVAKKTIIGSDYASLGSLIKKNRLGYTFTVNDSHALAECIEMTLMQKEKMSIERKNYFEKLRPERFYSEYDSLYKKATDLG